MDPFCDVSTLFSNSILDLAHNCARVIAAFASCSQTLDNDIVTHDVELVEITHQLPAPEIVIFDEPQTILFLLPLKLLFLLLTLLTLLMNCQTLRCLRLSILSLSLMHLKSIKCP